MRSHDASSNRKQPEAEFAATSKRARRRKARPPSLAEQRMDTDYDPPPEPQGVPEKPSRRRARPA